MSKCGRMQSRVKEGWPWLWSGREMGLAHPAPFRYGRCWWNRPYNITKESLKLRFLRLLGNCLLVYLCPNLPLNSPLPLYICLGSSRNLYLYSPWQITFPLHLREKRVLFTWLAKWQAQGILDKIFRKLLVFQHHNFRFLAPSFIFTFNRIHREIWIYSFKKCFKGTFLGHIFHAASIGTGFVIRALTLFYLYQLRVLSNVQIIILISLWKIIMI